MREKGKGSGGKKLSKREKEGEEEEEEGGGVKKRKVGEVKRKKERCGDVNRIEHGW